MEGRDFLVVPMIMMTEGVHQGSSGPLYYPASELSKIPAVWNHKPVVVYHPEANGAGISACDPEVLTNRKIGVIMNTKFEDGKLKAEAWLDIARTTLVDDRVVEAVNNGQMLELSTGLFTDLQETPGDWNGEAYIAIAVNYRPDHLAVLPDMKGSCSIADGAGFLRLNSEQGTLLVDITSMKDENRQLLLKTKPQTLQQLRDILCNELSFDDTRYLLYSKLNESKPNKDMWIEAVYEDFFIYEEGGAFKKQSYSITDGTVSFDGLPVDVRKETNYVLMNERKQDMDKKKFIDGLIANKATKWEESDRDALMAMEETVLQKLEPVANAEPEKKPEEDKKAETTQPVDNAAPAKAETLDEYLAKAPAELQNVLRNGISSYNADKKRLINIITANKKNPFAESELQALDVDRLRQIAVLASPEKVEAPQPLFNGQGDPVDNGSVTIEEPLPLPTMNFDSK